VSQTDGGQREYTYSADGRWWWDGRAWRPVRAAPPGGSGTGPRWLLPALIVVVLALTVPLGVTAVLIASRIGHTLPPRGMPPPPGAAPAMPYLPDASETGIELAATSHGLRCETGATVGIGRPPAIRQCQRASANGVMSVQTIGSDTGQVGVVTAAVIEFRPGDEAAALAFLQAVLSAAVAGPDAATDSTWLTTHFDHAGTSETTVEGVRLRLMVSSSQRVLVVGPASAPS
jgi:hypothetical protein